MNYNDIKGKLFAKINCFLKIKDVPSTLEYGNIDPTEEPPFISVIMPVYNRPDYFEKSLDSVINQKCSCKYEIVVCDNYDKGEISPNLSVVQAKAKQYGLTNIYYYRHKQNLGLNGSCNRGIEVARGKYVTFCHDDDLFIESTIDRLVELQKKCGDKCIVSKYFSIDTDDNYLSKPEFPRTKHNGKLVERDFIEYTLFDEFLESAGLLIASLFNREKLMDIGGFNEVFEPVSDYALHSQYAYYYGCVMNNVPTFKYRTGVNASMTLYTQFADAQRNIQLEILPKLKAPKFLLKRYIKTRYKFVHNYSLQTFGKCEDYSQYYVVNSVDKIYKQFLYHYLKYKNFKKVSK